MYFGEATTSIDDKGRMNIPTQYRAIMDVHNHSIWFATRGFDGAVSIYPAQVWEKLLNGKLGGSNLDPDIIDFKRFLVGSAAKTKQDGQWRMLLPQYLREFAGIDREAVILGVEDHLEVWNKAAWKAFQESQAKQYKAMAAELFGARGATAANQGETRDVEH